MKIYIPFNSNDFNSVFTTLSISPYSFYRNRKYSFKRASTSFLNESEDFLIGYEKPIFHNKEVDKDYGYPILIETDFNISESDLQTASDELRYLLIDNTVFLLDNFRLIFRREKELNETFAKSLKSIETKYASLAKENSEVVKIDCFINELPTINPNKVNPNINSVTFYKERKLNRLLGAILGSSISYSNSTSKEWKEISILLRLLNNKLSLFLNKIGERNDYEKKQSLDVIDQILKVYGNVETLDEAIMLGSNSFFTSDLLNTLKQSKIFNNPVFDLLIEGLLGLPKADLPLSLKLEKLKRAINSKYNSKYPNNFIERVNNSFSEVRLKIDNEIISSRKDNKLTLDVLVKPSFKNDKLEIKLPENFTGNENKYLIESLYFFIETDTITDLETFFTNRKSILIDLAKHFKDTIENFANSKEREYLIDLLKSFDSLRGSFNISGTSNEVLKSLAVLFKSGRDLLKYIENNEREEIHNSLIYYTLWGSIYGAAILPKTLTELITDDKSNIKKLIAAFSKTIGEYQNVKLTDYQRKEVPIEKTEFKRDELNSVISNISSDNKKALNEPNEIYNPTISVLGSLLLEKVEQNKKVKLADLKNISKNFKTNKDIEDLIKAQLNDKIKISKEGRTYYAEKIEGNELFD